MFASTTDDGGHSSQSVQSDPYDGNDDSVDMYDNDPLILAPPPSGKFSVDFAQPTKIKLINFLSKFRRWKVSQGS